jgi:small multidrug resistance family-3 protein
MTVTRSILLFVLAAVAEIGGAWLGRILAAYGGVFVAGSLLWGMALDGFRPDRWDVAGAVVCLIGVAVIMYAPRSA